MWSDHRTGLLQYSRILDLELLRNSSLLLGLVLSDYPQ